MNLNLYMHLHSKFIISSKIPALIDQIHNKPPLAGQYYANVLYARNSPQFGTHPYVTSPFKAKTENSHLLGSNLAKSRKTSLCRPIASFS